MNTFIIDNKYSFTINEHYKGDIKLMDNEFYCLMMENFGEDVTLEIKETKLNSAILKGWKFSIIMGLIILGI